MLSTVGNITLNFLFLYVPSLKRTQSKNEAKNFLCVLNGTNNF